MNEKLMKLMKGKKHGLSDTEKRAKMDVVKHMRSDAADMMKERLNGLKKVSVASDSPQGLQEGLEKAKQIVSNPHEALIDAENPYHDHKTATEEHADDEDNGMTYAHGGDVAPGDSQEHQDETDMDADGDDDTDPDHDEDDEMSDDDIDQKIAELMALKEAKKAKS